MKVSKAQKKEIAFKNEIIQGFYDKFTRKKDIIYFEWIPRGNYGQGPDPGDIACYLVESVNKALERK